MLETTFLYVAIGGGAVLALQLLLTLFGGDDIDGDVLDDGGDGSSSSSFWFFEMVSLRTLAACATFFGLAGLTARSFDLSAKVSLLIAGLAGFLAMYSVYWMFKQIFRLESKGNQDITRAVGLRATVYLRIPGKNTGRGKVHVDMQQRTVEYLAMTDDNEMIPSGANVLVMEVVNGETLRVVRETSAVASE